MIKKKKEIIQKKTQQNDLESELKANKNKIHLDVQVKMEKV
jgi:hypothetical protein